MLTSKAQVKEVYLLIATFLLSAAKLNIQSVVAQLPAKEA